MLYKAELWKPGDDGRSGILRLVVVKNEKVYANY